MPTWWRRFWCGFWGSHQWWMQRDTRLKRIYLECTRCGRQTPGWDLAEPQEREDE